MRYVLINRFLADHLALLRIYLLLATGHMCRYGCTITIEHTARVVLIAELTIPGDLKHRSSGEEVSFPPYLPSSREILYGDPGQHDTSKAVRCTYLRG